MPQLERSLSYLHVTLGACSCESANHASVDILITSHHKLIQSSYCPHRYVSPGKSRPASFEALVFLCMLDDYDFQNPERCVRLQSG